MNPVKNNGNLNKLSDPNENSGRAIGAACALSLILIGCVAVVALTAYLILR